MGCKPADSPIEVNHRLGANEGEKADKSRYQSLVGKLIYLFHTRLDVAYAVGVVSQFMQNPKSIHMEVVYRILRYLKTAPGKGLLFFNRNHLNVEGYTDAD